MKYKLIQQDIMEFCKNYNGEKFMAIFTDPPYHLASIQKRFGGENSSPAKYGENGVFQRSSAGFMQKTWDSDIAFRPETWESIGKLLYPGAFGMAFGGSRTAHRMTVAIEDAGFIIHPMIGWVYASGFPKATRVKGHEEFDGYRYGTQALKPALEPIIVFQKPYGGKPVESIVETGAGALNIDGGRIGVNASWSYPNGAGGLYSHSYQDNEKIASDWNKFSTKEDNRPVESIKGRWPANFLLTHSPECKVVGYKEGDSYRINRFTDGAKPFGDGAGHEFESEEMGGGRIPVWECADGCPAKALDEQTGIVKPVLSHYNVWGKECELCGAKFTKDVNTFVGKKTGNKRDNLQTDGFGSNQTEKSQKDTRYIILTMTNSITICQTCNSSRQNGMMTIINDLEKTIKQLMTLSIENASVASNIKRLIAITQEKMALTMDIVKNAKETICVNGENDIPIIAGITCESGEKEQGVSRFFHQSHWMFEENDPFIYQTKVSPSERNAGLSDFEEQLYGQSGGAQQALKDGEEEYLQEHIGLNKIKKVRNPHPTLKPISLCAHLATLLLPPDKYRPRKILVPFAGTGSEMIGAFQAGWDYAIGVELEKEYVKIGRPRIDYWLSQGVQLQLL